MIRLSIGKHRITSSFKKVNMKCTFNNLIFKNIMKMKGTKWIMKRLKNSYNNDFYSGHSIGEINIDIS